METIELNKVEEQQVLMIRNQLHKWLINREEANRRLAKYKLMI